MNIPLFIESLNDNEFKALSNYFLNKSREKGSGQNITIEEFLIKAQGKLHPVILRGLRNSDWVFVEQINRHDFLKMKQIGMYRWNLFEAYLIDNGYTNFF